MHLLSIFSPIPKKRRVSGFPSAGGLVLLFSLSLSLSPLFSPFLPLSLSSSRRGRGMSMTHLLLFFFFSRSLPTLLEKLQISSFFHSFTVPSLSFSLSLWVSCFVDLWVAVAVILIGILLAMLLILLQTIKPFSSLFVSRGRRAAASSAVAPLPPSPSPSPSTSSSSSSHPLPLGVSSAAVMKGIEKYKKSKKERNLQKSFQKYRGVHTARPFTAATDLYYNDGKYTTEKTHFSFTSHTSLTHSSTHSAHLSIYL